MADDGAGKETPPIYQSTPPKWLPKTSSLADLGFHGFNPPRPDQEEDLLTDSNVKNGFALKHTVTAETYTTKTVLIKTLKEDDFFPDLEDFMNQIFKRRAENLPSVPPSSFRMPSRVTLNDAKRQAWFADLANPDVPLYKLGKSVPHGAKGHDLLDLLQVNNVAIPRAVWFLRVFGSNETAGMRNKPNYNPMQYSVDWANVVTSYLKKQLADIALPSAPRPGLYIKQTFKGVLSDSDTRERWVSRFAYCLELLRTFYSEGMIDHGTFLSWLVQQIGPCNMAQAGFLARLTDDYLDGLVNNRALTRPLVDGCLAKLTEISNSASKEDLIHLQERLIGLLRRILLAAPASFVSPRIWTIHSENLRRIFTENVLDPSGTEPHIEQSINGIRQTMLESFVDIETRNEALLFRNLPHRAGGLLRSTVSDVHLLNSLSVTTDISTTAFFDVYTDDDNSAFAHKLDILLSWCITPLQYGDHRQYAAVTLLRIWREKAEERASRRDFTSPDEILQDQLFDWLDSCDIAAEAENLPVVSLLFGELVEKELFSYAKYIQRVIARGEPGMLFDEVPGSRHRNFLRSIPLHKSTPALINQRKVILHGVRSREIPEDQVEKAIRKELRAVLPELFGCAPHQNILSLSELQLGVSVLRSASRYEQVRTVRQWLLPILRRYLLSGSNSLGDQSSPLTKIYCVTVQIMELIKCYRSILDASLGALLQTSSHDLLLAVVETLRRHVDIWACMNAISTITQALYTCHLDWKSRGMQTRPLLTLLIDLDNGKHLDAASRQQINADITHLAHVLCPVDDHPEAVPPVLPEILLLAQDPNPDAPSVLANSLWYKYRTSFDWAWTVWDNAIASLRQIPLMMVDLSARRTCALRYAKFLFHVDQHLARGLDDHAQRWFLGSGLREISALTAEAWDVVSVVLLYLSVHAVLMTPTLLCGVVYPGWQYGSAVTSDSQWQSVAVFVRAANNLCQDLLLSDEGKGADIPPVDLLEIQRIRTRRQDVYREPYFSLLVNNMPTLVFLEKNIWIEQDLREVARSLRYAICQSSDFRMCAYRNLDAVRTSFEKPLDSETMSEEMHEPLVSALRLILSDAKTDIISPTISVESERRSITSFLSPWMLSASAIAIQFVLKQMGEGLAHDTTKETANGELDKFTERLFHHNMSSEEADFVAEMARGIDTAVAGKFLNNGLRRIAEILDETLSCEPVALTTMVRSAGEFLKLLSNIVKPFRDHPPSLPHLQSSVQDMLMGALAKKFTMLEAFLRSELLASRSDLDCTHVTEATIFLSRLLQFDLGFPGVWTPHAREIGDKILQCVFSLTLLHGGGLVIDPMAFPLLLDTVFYLFDESPIDSKLGNADLFQHCPSMESSGLPTAMPAQYRDCIRSILRYTAQGLFISNLVHASRDETGKIQLGQPVQNRPWEWIENLGDPPAVDRKEQQKESEEKERLNMKYLVRNNASVSLDLFSTRLTGEGVAYGGDEYVAATKMFEDNLTSGSMYERDWRESRIDFGGETNSNKSRGEDEEEGGSSNLGARSGKKAISHRASPAPSTHSRSSADTSKAISSGVQSPAFGLLSGRASGEPIDVDSINILPSTSSKRTASAASIGDDEDVVLIEGPNVTTRSTAKKSKPKVVGKTRAKKK